MDSALWPQTVPTNVHIGKQTCRLVKLIVHRLWQESYDKVIAAVREIIKKTCGSTHTEEVIDLTTDKPPEEFAMLIDLPLDEEDAVTVKNEPEDNMDKDGYKDWDRDDMAAYEDEEAAYSVWS